MGKSDENINLEPVNVKPKKINKAIVYFVIFLVVASIVYAFTSGSSDDKKTKKPMNEVTTTQQTPLNDDKLKELESQKKKDAQKQDKQVNEPSTTSTRNSSSNDLAPAPTEVREVSQVEARRQEKAYKQEEAREKETIEANKSGVFFNLPSAKSNQQQEKSDTTSKPSTGINEYYNNSSNDGYIQVVGKETN